MKKILTIIALIILLGSRASAATPAMADSAYNREMYTDAAILYKQLLNENGPSATLYYNLGNALYRTGNIAGAVLNYERALRLDPTMTDARLNLQFVNSQLQDKLENNNSFFTSLHTSVIEVASANAWAWIAFASFVLLCGAIALYIFSGSIGLRKLGFFGGIVLLVITVYFIVVAADANTRMHDRSMAIITAQSTMLNSSPRQPRQTEKVVPLHQGTKVQILDSIATPDDPVSPHYYKVSINGSTPAWLRATDAEII